MKILCIGQTTYDITYYTDSFPVEGTKNKVCEKFECPGGGGFNATAILNKWGSDVSLASVIGNDIYGNEILKFFQSEDIEEAYLQKNDGHTSLATVVSDTTNGERTLIGFIDNNLIVDDFEIDFNPDLIINDGHYTNHFVKYVAKYPNTVSIIGANKYNEETIAACKVAKYIICSKNFVEKHTNLLLDINNKELVINIFNQLERTFTGTIIITLDKYGSLVKKDGNLYLIPSINVKAVNSNGAGDIYLGAFSYGVINNWPLAKIMKVANISAALTISKKGCYDSIPSIEEVLKNYEENC